MTTPPVSTDSVRIKLRIGDELATATLAGTPAARDLAAMLPLQLDLGDPMGQAKSGRLPGPLDLTSAEPVFDPAVGELYYWAPSDTFAIFYEDFGQSIPDPGLVRVGAVDSGMDRIAGAGNDFTVRIDLLPTTSSRSRDQSKTWSPSYNYESRATSMAVARPPRVASATVIELALRILGSPGERVDSRLSRPR